MPKKIAMILMPLLILLNIPIILIAGATTENITYLDEDNIEINVVSGSEIDEDTQVTLYGNEYPEGVGGIDWICFLDTNENYTDQCIEKVHMDSIVRSGIHVNYIQFTLPKRFATVSGPTGYIEVRLETGEYYRTPYELENYLYNLPNQILVLRLDGLLYGHNLPYEITLNVGEQDVDISSSIIENDIIYLEMPKSINQPTGIATIYSGGSPMTNKIEVYIAPHIFDDPYQIWQGYLVQSDIYNAFDEYYNPTNQVVVAVIDSGVDINHEELQNSIWTNSNEISGNNIDDDNNGYIDDVYGWTYRLGDSGYIIDPSNTHGTKVAGIIAAEQDNGEGGIGLASNVKIMSLDVSSSSSSGIDTDYVVDAIYYAADNGADIINLSLGGIAYNSYESAYDQAIEYAYKKGCLIVAAAGNGNNNNLGNEGINLNNIPGSPICNDGSSDMVLGVAAVDGYKELTSYSNYGSDCVDLTALGNEVFSTTWSSDGSYSTDNSGTSFSAPIVSGIAAMIKGQYPGLENWQIQYLLKETGENINSLQEDSHSGEIGRLINATNAFEEVSSIDYPSKPTILGGETFLFNDLSISHNNATAIEYLYNNGVISGYDDGTFRAETSVNRAELLKILVEGQGVSPSVEEYNNCFPDVTDEWFAPYVCYALEEGWVSGYPDNTFKPGNTTNKVEAIKMLINSQGIEDQLTETVDEELFSDTDNTAWYAPYLKLAKDLEILEETGSTFNPSGEMNRGGICENLYRLLIVLE